MKESVPDLTPENHWVNTLSFLGQCISGFGSQTMDLMMYFERQLV